MCFNPPYNVNVKANIGETFLEHVDKNFPKTNKFPQTMLKLATVIYLSLLVW